MQNSLEPKPPLLSNNGASYISGGLAEWLKEKGMKHSCGAPYYPQTHGKIERWHPNPDNGHRRINFAL